MTTHAVLCFLVRDGEVLLIRKRKGFGAGKLAGVGGRIEPGETPEQAAVREVYEEVGVCVRSLVKVGVLTFYSTSDEPDWVVHVYLSRDFEGEPELSDEAEPLWCSMNSLPLAEMWEDDSVWLQHALSGNFVIGRFWYDEGYKRMLKWELTLDASA